MHYLGIKMQLPIDKERKTGPYPGVSSRVGRQSQILGIRMPGRRVLYHDN